MNGPVVCRILLLTALALALTAAGNEGPEAGRHVHPPLQAPRSCSISDPEVRRNLRLPPAAVAPPLPLVTMT